MPDPILDVKPPVEPSTPLPGTPTDPTQPAATPPEGVKPPEPGSATDPAQLLAALKEERDRRRSVEAENDMLRQPQQPQVPEQIPGTQPQQDVRAEIQKAWDEGDAQKAVNIQLGVALEWYDRVNSGLDQQRDDCRGKYTDFSQYESNALSYVRRLPVNQRSVKGIVEMAYLVEKGKNADSVNKTAQEQAVEEAIKRLQAGQAVGGIPGGAGTPPAPTGSQATPEMIAAAGAMGMTIDDYMKHVKR